MNCVKVAPGGPTETEVPAGELVGLEIIGEKGGGMGKNLNRTMIRQRG